MKTETTYSPKGKKLSKARLVKLLNAFKIIHNLISPTSKKDWSSIIIVSWIDEAGKSRKFNQAYKDQDECEKDFWKMRMRLDRYEHFSLQMVDMDFNKMAEIVK